MPRVCSICSHTERQAIEEALFRNNVPFRNVSKQFKVTVSALFRHKEHVSEQQVRTVAEITAELPPKKQRYLGGRVAGKSKRQAALEAGYSEAMADHPGKIETKDVRHAFAALMRETVPPERIAKAISEGLDAMETKFFSSEGEVKDSRDVIAWSERRQYAELAASWGGYHVPDKGDREQGGGVLIILPRTDGGPKRETGVVVEGGALRSAEVILNLPKDDHGS
jgi:hypothetical protein